MSLSRALSASSGRSIFSIEAEISEEDASAEEEEIIGFIDEEDDKVSQAKFLCTLGLCTPNGKLGLPEKKTRSVLSGPVMWTLNTFVSLRARQ